ncbi:MAG: zinc ABC transporter substrate-binding protein [Chloroflexi bacterium]|nr:zinc ABC transporter substrate-binding protein [Chloroflexota bacterium]
MNLGIPRRSCADTLFSLWMALLLGVFAQAEAAESRKLKVVTSFLPTYCFAVNVAGEWAEVENLLPESVSPHDFQLAPKDLRKLASADLLIINGLSLEAWLDKVIKAISSDKPVTVVEAAVGLRQELIYEAPALNSHPADSVQPALPPLAAEQGSIPNPHFWLDPRLACLAVTNIMSALQKADPRNAAGYARNAATYVTRLHELDGDLRGALEPLGNKAIVTFHNAFPYFARRYGLRLVGVIEETADVPPSPRYLATLKRAIRENEVRAIFAEPQSSSRLVRQMARDLRISVAELDTLETGSLTPNAYEEGMRRNLKTILKSLRPDAP